MNNLNSIVIGTVYEIGNGSPGGRGAVYDVNYIAPTILQTSGGQSAYDKRVPMLNNPGQFLPQGWRRSLNKKTSYGFNSPGSASQLWNDTVNFSII